MVPRISAALALTVTMAMAAAAQEPVAPAEFESLSQGRSLHFTLDGLPFGAEQFFADRRSLWRSRDGTCTSGRWQAVGELFCFTYDDAPAPQCWRLARRGGTLTAVFVEDGREGAPTLELARIDGERLDCPGPKVGS